MKRFLEIFFISLFLMGILLSTNSAFGKNNYSVILFYADWNVYSGKAIETMQKVCDISGGNFSLKKINIDDPTGSIGIQHLGIKPQYSIPSYVILDKNDKILYETKFYDENPEIILKNIKRNLDD